VKKVVSRGAAVGAFALVLAACGGGGNSVSTPTKPQAKKVAAAAVSAAAAVTLADSGLGKILVDANGMTLYEFDHDTSSTVTCTGGCAGLWPALVATGAPTAGPGLDASKLATISGPNGVQVTYGGHPLYRFAQDHVAGDVNGQGFAGGIWWVLGADGQKVTTTASAPTPSPSPATPMTSPPHATQAPATPAPAAVPAPVSPAPAPPPPPPTTPTTSGYGY